MNTGRRARVGLFVGAILLAASVVAALIVRGLPAVTDGELEDARRVVDTEAARQIGIGCERPVLAGEAIAADGTDALTRLVDPAGPFAPCLALDGAAIEEGLFGNLGARSYRWDFEERSLNDGLPTHADWSGNVALGAPPYPEGRVPPAFREALVVCAALPDAIHDVVQHASVCSPFGVGRAVPADGLFTKVFAMLKAARVHARARLRDGATFDALALLLETAQLAHDLGRGPVDLLVRMISHAGHTIVVAELQTLLALELDLSDAERAELRRRLDRLVEGIPPPRDMIRGELVRTAQQQAYTGLDPGYVPPGGRDLGLPSMGLGEARLAVFMTASDLLDPGATCLAELSFAECATALRRRVSGFDRWQPEDLERLALFLGSGLARGALLESLRRARLDSMLGVVVRVASSVAQLRGLRVLLALQGLRREGACPDASEVPAEDLEVPQLGGALTFYELVDRQQLEIHAPPALVGESGRVGLPVLLTLCPPRRWAEAGRFFEGTRPEARDSSGDASEDAASVEGAP